MYAASLVRLVLLIDLIPSEQRHYLLVPAAFPSVHFFFVKPSWVLTDRSVHPATTNIVVDFLLCVPANAECFFLLVCSFCFCVFYSCGGGIVSAIFHVVIKKKKKYGACHKSMFYGTVVFLFWLSGLVLLFCFLRLHAEFSALFSTQGPAEA